MARGPKERWGKPVRLRPELHERLATEAERRGFTQTWLLNKLVSDGLSNLRPIDEAWLTHD